VSRAPPLPSALVFVGLALSIPGLPAFPWSLGFCQWALRCSHGGTASGLTESTSTSRPVSEAGAGVDGMPCFASVTLRRGVLGHFQPPQRVKRASGDSVAPILCCCMAGREARFPRTGQVLPGAEASTHDHRHVCPPPTRHAQTRPPHTDVHMKQTRTTELQAHVHAHPNSPSAHTHTLPH